MIEPNLFTRIDTTGITASATSVSCQLIENMNASAPMVITNVSAGYMMPGPSTIRTAVISCEARDIKSPVRQRWKNDGSSSEGGRRITPQVVLDPTRYSDQESSHPEPEKPSTAAIPTMRLA